MGFEAAMGDAGSYPFLYFKFCFDKDLPGAVIVPLCYYRVFVRNSKSLGWLKKETNYCFYF
jgi:hypothetical protein